MVVKRLKVWPQDLSMNAKLPRTQWMSIRQYSNTHQNKSLMEILSFFSMRSDRSTLKINVYMYSSEEKLYLEGEGNDHVEEQL